jgi:hypothetical protein
MEAVDAGVEWVQKGSRGRVVRVRADDQMRSNLASKILRKETFDVVGDGATKAGVHKHDPGGREVVRVDALLVEVVEKSRTIEIGSRHIEEAEAVLIRCSLGKDTGQVVQVLGIASEKVDGQGCWVQHQ